jgi:Suppressor of fused protein (SUFU).
MSNAPVVLLEQPNNRGTITAVVEQDDRTAYFYLYPSDVLGGRYNMRPCWLRNLVPAPASKDVQGMQNGMAPLLEARFCNHPEGKAPLDPEELAIMWTEEDDGAAVFYQGQPLGIIPGWSLSSDRPVGYATDCIGSEDESILFPLGNPESNILHQRIERSAAFWDKWGDEEHNPWMPIQQEFLNAYEEQFDKMLQYYAIDEQKWPPMALARFEKDNIVYFISLGISIRPMPWVELLYNDKAPGFRRMELGLAVDKNEFTEAEIMAMAQGLSGIADSPWRNLSWFGEGHTISSQVVPPSFESFILSSALYNGPAINLPQMEGDKVNLYWASPITKAEREFAHSKANGGYDLLEKMIQSGITHVVKKREGIIA